MEQWASIRPGSIYFALSQMEKEGLVTAGVEERTGDRLRRVYSITVRGREALKDLVRQAISTPPHSLKSSFSFALGPADLLEPAERIRLLDENIQRLQETKRLWEAGQAVKAGWHPALRIIFEHDLDLIKSDIRLLNRLKEYTGEYGHMSLVQKAQSNVRPRSSRKRKGKKTT